MKYLTNTPENRILQVKNNPLELEKDFKPINVFLDDTDKSAHKK